MNLNIIITKDNTGGRIDKFLVELAGKEKSINKLSRADLARAVKDRKVLVNDKKVKPGYVLREEDKISIKYKALSTKHKKVLLPNSEVKFKIIYKDKNIIAVDKPAGLLVHPVKPASHEANSNNALVNRLISQFPEIIGVGDKSNDSWARPGIVHRLDKDTSGVIIVARNQKSFDELKKLFKNRKIKKKYLAIVYGKLKNKSGVIKKPIARSGNYKKQVIAGRKTKTKIREAVTEYKVLEEFKNYSLVEARPRTGRMHQIRVHFFSLGHPVVGDKIYKIKNKLKSEDLNIKAKRQLLHASQIQFELLGKKYFFSSSLPSDFDEFLPREVD